MQIKSFIYSAFEKVLGVYSISIGCLSTASSPVDRLIHTILRLKGTAVTPTS